MYATRDKFVGISKMEKIYDVVEDSSIINLKVEVNIRMEQGWEPLGGICATFYIDKDGTWYYQYAQAMILRKMESVPK